MPRSTVRQNSSTCAGLCPAGKYSTGGASACSPCPVGTYGSVAGLTTALCTGSCSSLPGASCGAAATAANGTVCPPGQYASVSNAASCSLCQPGTYAPVAGMATCLQCGPVRYQSSALPARTVDIPRLSAGPLFLSLPFSPFPELLVDRFLCRLPARPSSDVLRTLSCVTRGIMPVGVAQRTARCALSTPTAPPVAWPSQLAVACAALPLGPTAAPARRLQRAYSV